MPHQFKLEKWDLNFTAEFHQTVLEILPRILHSCGFDSIPCDIAVSWLISRARELLENQYGPGVVQGTSVFPWNMGS